VPNTGERLRKGKIHVKKGSIRLVEENIYYSAYSKGGTVMHGAGVAFGGRLSCAGLPLEETR